MCGINGIISKEKDFGKKISAMNRVLRHRGPDDEGFVVFNTASGKFRQLSGPDTIDKLKNIYPDISEYSLEDFDVFLGHRRLSIIDLSEKGHGPMTDSEKRYWITYNGEIYNYIELREELRSHGCKFQTESDTEVILNAYKKWGEDCLNKFNGMWAFAIWDSSERTLFAARDRFGVKPLYYVNNSHGFAFSSEIKALLLLNENPFEINQARIPFYLLYGNRLNSEETYYKDVCCLKASHCLLYREGEIKVKRYYDIENLNLRDRTDSQLKEELTRLLFDSIKLRFRSDVPVGTCLSGGFDSSSIVAFSNRITGKGLNTFSAVWKDKSCDESRYIDIVNNKFGCTPNKTEPDGNEFEKVFNELNYYQEIPTEGPGLYPQWYVMKKAREKVKVLLDGQGGDEVFGGYFMMGTYLRSMVKDFDYIDIINNLRLYLSFFGRGGIHSFSGWVFPVFYNKVVRRFFGEKSSLLNKDFVKKTGKGLLDFDAEPPRKFGKGYLNNFSYHLMTNMTIPSLLHYEDRSSMAHSIESRVPFLDYRLVEFGINLPKRHLVHENTSRPLYRQALTEFLPEEIVNRTDKLGYPTPFTMWSRSNLKSYVQDTFNKTGTKLFDYVDRNYLNEALDDHFKLKKDFGWEIWRLLSLEKFLDFQNHSRSRIRI